MDLILSGNVAIVGAVAIITTPLTTIIGDDTTNNITLLGSASTEEGTEVSMTIAGEVIPATSFMVDVSLVGSVFSAEPFYAAKLTVVEPDINEVTLGGSVSPSDSVSIYGTAVSAGSIDIISPLTSFTEDLSVNLTLEGIAETLSYSAETTMTAYASMMTVEMSQIGTVISTEVAPVHLAAVVQNVQLLMTSTVVDSSAIRYEVADIDRGLQKGKIKMFPREWTIAYINKPVDEFGAVNTVASFLMPLLTAKYGQDIHNKISVVTARNPLSGEVYNYVVQNGYVTPSGSYNDFDLSYVLDEVYYPVPFMIKSISDATLEIEWEL